MLIKNLRMENFRNFDFESLEFSENVNIFYGKNGQGKTNLLEAVNYFTNGKSCRNNMKEKDVVKFGKENFSLAAEFELKKEGQPERPIYEKIDFKSKKSIYINGQPIEKLSDILGLIDTVLFMPNDIAYVTGAPANRRNYIDSFLSKNRPGYFKLLSSYIYVLKQKNNILKTEKNTEQLDIYNEKIFEYGSKICEIRDNFIKVFSEYVRKIYSDISESNETVEFIYKPCIEKYFDKNEFMKELEESKKRELLFGASLKGPHRDDISVIMSGKPAKFFSSQGQLRSIVLAMKIAEAEIIKDTKGEYPIMLLDDVFSELDSQRREFLLKNLSGKQVIMTITNADISRNFSDAACFEIENGKIIKK